MTNILGIENNQNFATLLMGQNQFKHFKLYEEDFTNLNINLPYDSDFTPKYLLNKSTNIHQENDWTRMVIASFITIDSNMKEKSSACEQ